MKLIRQIFTVFLVVFLLAFLLEKIIDFGIRHNNNIKVSYAFQGKLDADIWVHGPCEPLFSIDPKLLEEELNFSVYNTAVRHTDFADNFLQLNLALEQNAVPKIVLLYVTPESFDEQYNAFHSYRYASFDSEEIDSVLFREDKGLYWTRWIPLAKYAYHNQFKTWKAIQGWKDYISSDDKAYFEDGYQEHKDTDFTESGKGYSVPGDFKFKNGVVATITEEGVFYQMYDADQEMEWSKDRAASLSKIIELCTKKGVKLALYESPVFKEFADQAPNRAKMIGQIDSLSKAHSIPFWTFDALEMRKDQRYFVSPLILSEKGTAAFTPVLADSISTLLE